jgi:hypothetical protein
MVITNGVTLSLSPAQSVTIGGWESIKSFYPAVVSMRRGPGICEFSDVLPPIDLEIVNTFAAYTVKLYTQGSTTNSPSHPSSITDPISISSGVTDVGHYIYTTSPNLRAVVVSGTELPAAVQYAIIQC